VKKWTDKDDETLRRFYPTMETSLLATRLGCSPRSVHHRANKVLGIRKEERSKPMVAPDPEVVKQNRRRARGYLLGGYQ
jgi:predicted ATP-grasp superfamily ATP-dependent carboligase